MSDRALAPNTVIGGHDGDVVAAEARRRESQQALRERIWQSLRQVARPDARFHWDFTAFIPDFAGNELCVDRIRSLPAYQEADLLFITPDNSLERIRVAAMEDGKRFLMTTHGISRGFFLLEPDNVQPSDRRHAATLDGFEHYATPVTLDELQHMGPLPLLITGASAMSLSGVRFGKGHGYFDLEWAILCELGAVTLESQIAGVGHDCQVTDEPVPASPFDTLVNWIVTPTRLIEIQRVDRALGRLEWDAISADLWATIPSLTAVRTLLEARANP